MTLSAVPRTVTVAVAAVRRPVTIVHGFEDVAAAGGGTNEGAAAIPSAALPVSAAAARAPSCAAANATVRAW